MARKMTTEMAEDGKHWYVMIRAGSSYQDRGNLQFSYQINVKLGSVIGRQVATHVNAGV